MLKKLLSLGLALGIMAITTTSVFAAETGKYVDDSNFDIATRLSSDEFYEYEITDPELIQEELKKDGMEGYDVAKIVTYIKAPEQNSTNSPNSYNETPYFWNRYSLKNVSDEGSLWYFPNKDYAPVSGGPGGTITISDTQSSSYTFNGSFGVSASVVEADLGVELEKSYQIAREYSYDLAPGEVGVVKSWAYYDKYTYDIYKNDKHYEDGNLSIPNGGVRFRYYKLQG